jgi:hypothetical protein
MPLYLTGFYEMILVTKLHLISKYPFWCLQIDQTNNQIFVRISALASKKRSAKMEICKLTRKIKKVHFAMEYPVSRLSGIVPSD